VPEHQAVFSAGHRNQDACVIGKHLLRFDGPRDLLMDETGEAIFAKGGIVPSQSDHGFGAGGTSGAVHS
jgi:hypothetical protein